MKFKFLAFTSIAGAFFSPHTAFATTLLTNTLTISSNITSTELDEFLTLPTFNTALGTLTSVHITETGDIYISADSVLTNNASKKETFTYQESSTFTFTSGNTSLDNLLGSITTNQASKTYTNIASHNTVSFGSYTLTASNSFFTTDTNILGLFEGTPLSLEATTETSAVFTGGGNILTNVTTTGEASINIYFDYTPIPVPEPEQIAMFLLGLPLVSWHTRRRQIA